MYAKNVALILQEVAYICFFFVRFVAPVIYQPVIPINGGKWNDY